MEVIDVTICVCVVHVFY